MKSFMVKFGIIYDFDLMHLSFLEAHSAYTIPSDGRRTDPKKPRQMD